MLLEDFQGIARHGLGPRAFLTAENRRGRREGGVKLANRDFSTGNARSISEIAESVVIIVMGVPASRRFDLHGTYGGKTMCSARRSQRFHPALRRAASCYSGPHVAEYKVHRYLPSRYLLRYLMIGYVLP